MKMIFISSQDIVEEVDLSNDDQIREKIGGWMEIVRPVNLPGGYRLVVDEEGLLKQRPPNKMGSIWYGFFKHGHPIVGDILVTRLDSEGDFIPLTDEDISFIQREIKLQNEISPEIK